MPPIYVLDLSGDRISAMTRLEDGVLESFGLPRSAVVLDATALARLALLGDCPIKGAFSEARNETRTRDPFLTMEVLYQLSYPGGLALRSQSTRWAEARAAPNGSQMGGGIVAPG